MVENSAGIRNFQFIHQEIRELDNILLQVPELKVQPGIYKKFPVVVPDKTGTGC